MEKLILASCSPRRSELLTQAGIPFETVNPDVNEECCLPADQAVSVLSARKAKAVGAHFPGRFILAADTLVALNGQPLGEEKRTVVSLFDLYPDSYVRSGEPLDKAGAYALQGRASLWITHLEGSSSSVIGLPLCLVRTLLIRSGYRFDFASET